MASAMAQRRLCQPRVAGAPKAPVRALQARRAPLTVAAADTKRGAQAVTDDTWDEVVLKSSVPVLVDFWAPWCGPCRMIAPIIDELAVEYKDKLKCVKINTDESPKVPTEYGIRSIPTVMIFKGGDKMDTIIGAVPKDTIKQTVEKYL